MPENQQPNSQSSALAFAIARIAMISVSLGSVTLVAILVWRSMRETLDAENTPNYVPTEWTTPMNQEHFNPVQVVKAAEPITRFPIVSASVASSWIEDDEQVIAVEVNGQTRAYSLNMLTGPDREIINDELGGEPIAVTWCHLCNSAVSFSRRVDEQVLTFAVSGLLWEGNLVMVDQPTGTLWSQLQAQGMRGPLAGHSLRLIPAVVTTWREWKRHHPDTTAAAMSRTVAHYRRAGADPHMGLCLAIHVGDEAVAIDFADLARETAIELSIHGVPVLAVFDSNSFTAGAYDRRLDERELSFTVVDGEIKEISSGSRLDVITGRFVVGALNGTKLRPVPSMIADPATWSLFHPRGRLWNTSWNTPKNASSPQ